jgi:hypothetical protein
MQLSFEIYLEFGYCDLEFIWKLVLVICDFRHTPGRDKPAAGKTIMQTKQMTLKWEGTFIELCLCRITPPQKRHIDAHCHNFDRDIDSLWYHNASLFQSLFDANNWWSVDNLDHAMGLVFTDRSGLDRRLAKIAFAINGAPASVDPEALQLSFYAPEAFDPLGRDEQILCHGARRQAVLHLQADFEPPFDPALMTLSFLHYPGYGYILIDLDYDGHDDMQFTWGDTTYLQPRFFGKEHFDDTSG